MPASSRTLRSVADLVAAGLAAPERHDELTAVAAQYAVALTPAMAALIDPADTDDPIARQFLPSADELQIDPRELADPIGDDAHSPVAGVVHRYPDRVLLKPVHVCAVYCRFCFRRTMVGPGKRQMLSPAETEAALGYVAAHPEIWEVILSGGDPLVLSPRRLGALVRRIAAIEHVKVLRVHTRIPAADPPRVTAPMLRAMKMPCKATYVVLHVNHARELTPEARTAIARIVDSGIPMLSQSVLLRGVNDDAATLEALLRALVECRVKPYYLHHADLAPGTAHLRTTIAEGQEVMRRLRGRVSGLCQPGYVLDIPGGHGKAPIGPSYLDAGEARDWTVTDYRGDRHSYRDDRS
jgi:lysine 2,3-aminomutase